MPNEAEYSPKELCCVKLIYCTIVRLVITSCTAASCVNHTCHIPFSLDAKHQPYIRCEVVYHARNVRVDARPICLRRDDFV